jgi:hypothetical protein
MGRALTLLQIVFCKMRRYPVWGRGGALIAGGFIRGFSRKNSSSWYARGFLLILFQPLEGKDWHGSHPPLFEILKVKGWYGSRQIEYASVRPLRLNRRGASVCLPRAPVPAGQSEPGRSTRHERALRLAHDLLEGVPGEEPNTPGCNLRPLGERAGVRVFASSVRRACEPERPCAWGAWPRPPSWRGASWWSGRPWRPEPSGGRVW